MATKIRAPKQVSALARSPDAQGNSESITVDIIQLSGYAEFVKQNGFGTYKLTVVASAPGYSDSQSSDPVAFINGYPINITVKKCSFEPKIASIDAFSDTTVTFTADFGYLLPTADNVTVTGATGVWTKETGTLVLSEATDNVSVLLTAVAKTYAIKVNGTNATVASGSDTTIRYDGTATLSFDYPRGYFAPASVEVGNATGNWKQDTNQLVISNPTGEGDVSVTIEGIEETYNIGYALTNCTAASGNPNTITSAATEVKLTISGNRGYALPDSISVSGVAVDDWSYDKAAGVITLSYPTGDVTITAVGKMVEVPISGVYKWHETIPDADWTEQVVDFQVGTATYKKMYWTTDGTSYDLYYDDMLEGGSATQVYSYNADDQTGTWVDPKYRVVNFGDTAQAVWEVFGLYVEEYADIITKLATPQNVEYNAPSSASWDEVENATEYEVVVNSESWGTTTPEPEYIYEREPGSDTVTLYKAPYTQDGDTVTIL